ncbi:hypothetical protein PTKIN_Ptkin06aG0185500 [Pterospermum kingtungense]
MEIHKFQYLRHLLQLQQLDANQGASVDEILNNFVVDFRPMVEGARNCYEGSLNMSPAQFVTMMVLDGLIVVELLRKFKEWILLLDLRFIPSATELPEVGIKFKKHWDGNSLFDIGFQKGRMYIPTLTVDHDTERIVRNLIAYEQMNHGPSIVTDYARLMDCLISYAEDVALLSDCRIIDNRLGTKEDVANMFNKLNDYVYLSTVNFYYTDLFFDVHEHCNRPWNRWKVKLRQKYFQTPWDWVLTSIVAATILLLLTFLQTLYYVLSYNK